MTAPVFRTYDAVDLFAGPGGWSVAARGLGLREIGIDNDRDVLATRDAAGFATIFDDVRAWGPESFPDADGLIGSPPCQPFSVGGKGAGTRSLYAVLRAAEELRKGRRIGPAWGDPRTGLVLEPLRWFLEALGLGLSYEWVALEQVASVLPVWRAFGDIFEAEGYGVAVGLVHAERYGVPQARTRAVLVARRGARVELPKASHSRWYPRSPDRRDDDVAPWRSMSEALGWETPRLVGFPRLSDAAREPYRAVTTIGGVDYRARDLRSSLLPAQAVTSKCRSWSAWPTLDAAPERISVEQASALQTFPPEFAWSGTRSKRFEQLANAIPPVLASAVLAEALGVAS